MHSSGTDSMHPPRSELLGCGRCAPGCAQLGCTRSKVRAPRPCACSRPRLGPTCTPRHTPECACLGAARASGCAHAWTPHMLQNVCALQDMHALEHALGHHMRTPCHALQSVHLIGARFWALLRTCLELFLWLIVPIF